MLDSPSAKRAPVTGLDEPFANAAYDVAESLATKDSGPFIGGAHDPLRDAVRAVAEFRRGAAVVIEAADTALAAATAETLGSAGLADLQAWASAPSLLIWPETDAGSATGGMLLASRRLAPRDLAPDSLRQLADPTLRPRCPADPAIVIPPGAVAAVALAKLARLLPTLIAAPMRPEAVVRARRSGAVVVQAGQVEALREAGTRLVRVAEAPVPLEAGRNARLVAFRNPESGQEHIAVVIGTPDEAGGVNSPGRGSFLAPLVRLHSECFTGDVLGSLRCDCGPQLRDALARMTAEGAGVLLYLAQEGRGIGLVNKLRSYALQDRGLDTLDANRALGWEDDARDFAIAGAMLRDLGVSRVRLMTNNPAKLAALAASGITVERASLLVAANGINDRYLATKAERFGHLMT